MNELIHYSQARIGAIRACPQNNDPSFKPAGLWVSVGDEWKDWCEGEDFSLARLKYRHVVELTPESSLLLLTTTDELHAFSNEYHRAPEWQQEILWTGLSTMYIDWSSVAKQYQGIIIDPYQWGCRLNSSCAWYYGWDCASGCIWDKAAIASVKEPTLKDLDL